MVTYRHGPVASSLLLCPLDYSSLLQELLPDDPHDFIFSPRSRIPISYPSPCPVYLISRAFFSFNTSSIYRVRAFPPLFPNPSLFRSPSGTTSDSWWTPLSCRRQTKPLSTSAATYYLLLLHAWVFGVAKSSSASLLSCCRRSRSFFHQRLDACHHASWVWCAIFIVIIIPQQIR